MDKVMLVDFFAEYCGACKAQDPILEELNRNIGDKIEIIKVNVMENRDIANNWKINATPTLFLIKGDSVFKKYIGLTDGKELESAINLALYQ